MIIVSAIGVVLGAIFQRIAGLGFALVVAPLFVITFGPYDGVLLINFGGTLSSIFVLTRMWRAVNWRRYLQIGPAAMLAIIPTSFLVVQSNGSGLQVGIGVILLVGLTISLVRKTRPESVPRWWLSALTGATAGVTSAAAGVGAPPMGIYALSTGWNQREFAATLQPIFFTTGATSFLSKILIAGELPAIEWPIWVSMVVLGSLGLTIGEWAKKYVPAPAARTFALVLCFAGALAATVDGVMSLVTESTEGSGDP